MTRHEHLAWAKQRALAYLPGDPGQAMASMVSDLHKHPELEDHCGVDLGAMEMMSGFLQTAEQVRQWIDGFH